MGKIKKGEVELFELSLEESDYLRRDKKINDDILPTRISDRKWGIYNVCACWIGMNICIPAYQMASSAITMGIDWGMALFLVLLGNLIILIPIQLNSYVGVKYGISFPIYARLSFGVKGASVPTFLRTVIGLFWTGILMWGGSESLYIIIISFIPEYKGNEGMIICFLVVWFLTVGIGYGGESLLRRFEGVCAPILIFVFIALMAIVAYKIIEAGDFFYEPLFSHDIVRDKNYWTNVLACLMANIAYYSTWALNIPDLSRYVKNSKSQFIGQALGMPSSMLFIAFVGVYITSASRVLFGNTIWDPNQVVALLDNKVLTVFFALGIFLATMTTNVTTNLLPSVNGILNFCPKKLTYKTSTLLAGIFALIIQPWKLVSDPNGYIYNWLGMYGILTGPVAGIFIIDYFFIKKQKINVKDLYQEKNSMYWYVKGYNYKAILSWIFGIILPVIGFIYNKWHWATEGGWIISFVIGALSYFLVNIKNRR